MPGDKINPAALMKRLNSILKEEEGSVGGFETWDKLASTKAWNKNASNKAWNKTADTLRMMKFSENIHPEEKVSDNWAHVRGKEMLVYYPRAAKQGNVYEQDQTVNPGWLEYHNIKDLLARFFVLVHAHHGKVGNWRDLCIGITSADHGGSHLPMFDYDGKNIKTSVKKDIKQLQNKFGLGDATIYETRRGLHVYFFSDLVEIEAYKDMLDSTKCCKGFKISSERNNYSVLRISAKYTEFDIRPYKVIVSPNHGRGRAGRKAALIQEFIRMGQACGTHFTSMYPQWGHYQEDLSPWKPTSKSKPTRRIRVLSKADYVKKKAYLQAEKEAKEQKYKLTYSNTSSDWNIDTTTDFKVGTTTFTYK